MLFTRLSCQQRYKSKAFIVAAVYRGGDLVSGWIYAGLAALGLAVGAIALLAVPVAVLWAVLRRRLERGEKTETGEKGEKEEQGGELPKSPD